MKYNKTPQKLKLVASNFWPTELIEIEANISVVPLLLETQDQFISVLNLANEVEGLFEVIEKSNLLPSVFLKHLVVLADFGGEMLKRVSSEFKSLFPKGEIKYVWNGREKAYIFKALPREKFSNTNLGISGKNLIKAKPLSDLQKDAISLLLFGSNHSNEDNKTLSALSKCEIGDYLGKTEELTRFIKQRYIWVSRIIAGAQANNLGQLAQQFVAQYISKRLGKKYSIKSSGRLPGVSHTDAKTGRLTSFDIVVSRNKKYVAIEVCFQVTTNSVIERKARQAKARFEQIEKAGHKIAYVIDGAGNFERAAALSDICAFSHCTVAFSQAELDVLCRFLKENL